MAWLTRWTARSAGLRWYRLTLKRALLLTLLSVVSLSLWNTWVTSSPRAIPMSNGSRDPTPFPLPLTPPLRQTPPTIRSDSQYTIGRTILGCSELSDPQTLVDAARLEFLQNTSRTTHEDSEDQLKSLLKNCTALKARHSYWRWPVEQQERDFPLAFGFKVHDAPAQFERFLRVLWRPHNLYVIHVDLATSRDIFQVFQDLADCFDNVMLTETRVDLIYASVVSLHADITCVKQALQSPRPWRYYMSVSGHEFPLRTNLEMVQILTLFNGTNDVENYRPSNQFVGILNHESVAHDKKNRMSKVSRAPFVHKDVRMRKGSAYFAATREFLAWTLRQPQCQDLLAWLNLTWAADEIYWATANYLPGAPGGGQVDISHSTETFLSRAMTWQWDRYKCHGRYVRAVCIYAASDLPWLLSRPELIANKFDAAWDPLVLDCLERALEERAERGHLETKVAALSESADPPPLLSTLNWTYYKALPHMMKARSGQPLGSGDGG